MFIGRKLRRKTLALLLAVSMLIMLLPGVSLGAGTLTSLAFVSTSTTTLSVTSGQTFSAKFNLFDDGNNQYTQPVYAYIVASADSDSVLFGSNQYTIMPDGTGKYTLAGINFSASGTYFLKVQDANKSQTVMGTIFAGPNTGNNLAYLNFVSEADQNLVTGVTQNINYKLYDQNGGIYTGPVTAYIQDPGGIDTSYPATSSSISNVTLDAPGEYTLYINTGSYTATGTITVADAKLFTSGSLITNYNSTVKGTLTKADGEPLKRQSFTVDATDVGGTSSTYTTLYDGTFEISMTPATLGKVKIILGGHTVGTIDVSPAYTAGTRIGSKSGGNADLSVSVAQAGWTKADNVILTRDDVVADAMVAVPLSKKLDAPILMTPGASLDERVLTEIKVLGAKKVYIIGGSGAVSESVATSLQMNGLDVVRIGGVDRYDTAAKIADWVNSPGTVYLAYGYGEPDALAAGALAAEQGIPILLSDTNLLTDVTKNELAKLNPDTVILLGGTGVLSTDLEEQVSAEYSVHRWGGADRYVTEQSIFQNFFNGKSAEEQFPLYITSAYVLPSDVGSGNPFGDALVTAALAAKKNGFVVTLPPNSLPSPISTFLLFNKVYIPSATVVGNSSAISYGLEKQLQQILAR